MLFIELLLGMLFWSIYQWLERRIIIVSFFVQKFSPLLFLVFVRSWLLTPLFNFIKDMLRVDG